MQPVFDGHNDVLLRLWQNGRSGRDCVEEFRKGTQQGHIDAPRSKLGGLAGGLCAIFVPNAGEMVLKQPDERGHYSTPLALPLQRADALEATLDMASIALRLDREGAWRLCRDLSDIEAAMKEGVFAAVLHLEGCEAIDTDLRALDVLHAAGLRSLGPVWSRNDAFGHGVPFAYPMSPDTGPGLTEAGFELVRACNRMGILVDLSHITEKGFWDVAKTSDRPLVASHSNAHALTPVARNLTDRQLDAIRESGGIVGLNFAVTMLRDDAADNADTPLSDMVRHVDYLVGRLGVEGVGIGADFDGATIPREIGDAAGLQKLVIALRQAGYDDGDLEKICRGNWMRVLRQTWNA